MNQPATVHRRAAGSRWALPFLAALVAVQAMAGLAGSASDASNPAAGTRVGAHNVAIDVLVEPPEHIRAGQAMTADIDTRLSSGLAPVC